MCFIDDQEIELSVMASPPAQRLEGNEVDAAIGEHRGSFPHFLQNCWRNYQSSLVAIGESESSESFSGSDRIAQKRAPEFADRFAQPRHSRELMRLKLDAPKQSLVGVRFENQASERGSRFGPTYQLEMSTHPHHSRSGSTSP
jgi:hypothetical protein